VKLRVFVLSACVLCLPQNSSLSPEYVGDFWCIDDVWFYINFLTYLFTYLIPYLLIYIFTQCSRVLREMITGFKVVKNFPAFYGTRKFITAFTTAYNLSIPLARSIQSTPSHRISWRSILTLLFHLCLSLPSGIFPSGFTTKILSTPLLSPIRATCPAHLILLDFITRKVLIERYGSLNSWLCSLLSSHFYLSHLVPNIFLYTLFSNTFSRRSSLNVCDQVSHPYDQQAKLYFCTSKPLNFRATNWKTKCSAPNDSKHLLILNKLWYNFW